MHTSEDLIYINNSRGTCWIEMSSNGKLDVYAQDSISFHTEVDMNFVADRDINFEAGRNINMIVNETIRQSAGQNLEIKVGVDGKIHAGSSIQTLSGEDTIVTAGGTVWIDGGPDVQLNGGNAATEAEKAFFPQRVPQHEPWNGHENWNPPEVEPEKTDSLNTTESQDIHPEDRTVQTDRTVMNDLGKE